MAVNSKTRSGHLASMIRQRIVSGEFAPGKRLPTFQEIESEFDVGRSVVQLAVARLKEDGFLRPKTENGLFVADHPPHLKRYGVVFPMTHGSMDWSRFDDVLVREAHLMETQSVIREFDIFAGTDDHREGDSVLERLKSECRRDRLAGVILTPGTHELAGYQPLNDERLPKVFVFASEREPWRPIVSADSPSMIRRGLEWLVGRGRKRVAVIRVSDYASTWDWREFYQQAGLEYRPQWVQAVGRCDPSVVQTLMPLLMDYPAGERPDGVFILDDNLVDYGATALAGMGLRLGEDVDLVAHSNWPQSTPKMLPMQRIGFHASHLLDRCLKVIDAQRRGESVPDIQLVPALFEDEADLA